MTKSKTAAKKVTNAPPKDRSDAVTATEAATEAVRGFQQVSNIADVTDAMDNLQGKIHGLSAGSTLDADQIAGLQEAFDDAERKVEFLVNQFADYDYGDNDQGLT